MRYSQDHKAQTHRRIIKEASARFRRDGIGATGLQPLMKALGLTHGGFYSHFESKDELVEKALQAAGADTDAEQVVMTTTDEVKEQQNNNASVQIKGSGSQKRLQAVSLANIAGSAANVGQNIASFSGKELEAIQVNGQVAAARADTEQYVSNAYPDDSNTALYQNNNNSSVQLRDSQTEVKALSILNTAGSAANVGQNIARAEAEEVTRAAQVNAQGAFVTAEARQLVYSDEVKGQNNNNASVQLIDSQTNSTALSTMNAAVSAVNVGQNIVSMKQQQDVSVSQANLQLAVTRSSADQYVENYGNVEYQNNNDSSIQLIDSQFSTNALSVANVAGSAVNFGQNMATMTGVKGAALMQLNLQKAVKF